MPKPKKKPQAKGVDWSDVRQIVDDRIIAPPLSKLEAYEALGALIADLQMSEECLRDELRDEGADGFV